MAGQHYTGVFPVVPTTFTDDGDLDLDSQKRCLDFLVESGANGLCILANYSEQFVLSDAERELLTRTCLQHVAGKSPAGSAGRLPVIVTTSHFSSRIAAQRSRQAQDLGAAMVMLMPPYHGASFRATEQGIYEFFQAVSGAIDIPIMIQDAPVSGTTLSAAFLARLATEIENVSHFKIEVPGAAAKLREMIRLGGSDILGPWDGEESITLISDLDAGANGTMPSASIPDVLRQIVDDYQAGRRDAAITLFERFLPLINCENKQVGLHGCKALLKAAGIIRSDAVRHPIAPLHPQARQGLLEIARRLNPLIMRWGH